MNAILKFKEGRKILKAQGGVRTSAPVEETIGDWVRESNRSLFGSGMRWYNRNNPVGRLAVAMKLETRVKDANGKEWILKPNGTKVLASLRDPKPVSTPVDKPADKVTNDAPAAVVQKPAGRGVVKRTLKSQEQWDNDFQTMASGLSSQQRMYLDSLGIDMSSAEAMQAGINKHLGNNNLAVDNKWGGKSQEALDALLRYMPKDYQNDDMKQGLANEVNLPDDAVIDAPDPFGYKTSNTYEGDDFASKMKGMGIRSNADLINFMHNSGKAGWKGDAWQTQFRSDVDKALGGDYSDANIRKVFGTQGRWGRGFMGRGDFGDFQNALRTNAGVWNGMYDRKESEARMDASRQQLATKMAQQYIEQNPIQLTAPKKFTIGNNIGANTLGDAGAGSMSNLKQVKYADK